MPELPEVETTMRGIKPYLLGQRVERLVVREPRLRWPVQADSRKVEGQRCETLVRRAKYLLLGFETCGLIVHLGMSGSLRVIPQGLPAAKHDHIDMLMENGRCLRFTDPRRFGAFVWVPGDVDDHDLLRHLGPEPLSGEFTADYLYARSRGRKTAIKNFIMNGHIVVGVGNIYASEALFMAGIHPQRAAGRVSRARYLVLVDTIRTVLEQAIEQGGTTLRDYTRADGFPGYFAQKLLVYGRGGDACFRCGEVIRNTVIGQRASFYCPACQT